MLIRVSTCGVCHTELDEIEGRTPPPNLPVVLGHQVVGIVQSASAEQAKQAIESAHAYFDTWKKVPAERRAEILFKAAGIIRQRKFETSALICYEVGKSWAEADADTAETIDFLEYYGREMLRLAGPHDVVPYQSERNFMVYIPLGAGAAIRRPDGRDRGVGIRYRR